jgi:hypothetical protein
MPKKISSLIPSEREKECTQHNFAYTGKIPNTGPIRCTMCGLLGKKAGLQEPSNESMLRDVEDISDMVDALIEGKVLVPDIIEASIFKKRRRRKSLLSNLLPGIANPNKRKIARRKFKKILGFSAPKKRRKRRKATV